ncbi:MAG: hypothetical protein ACJA1L_000909 [Paracoccaceae bacterium]|jgi:hypothetical protein
MRVSSAYGGFSEDSVKKAQYKGMSPVELSAAMAIGRGALRKPVRQRRTPPIVKIDTTQRIRPNPDRPAIQSETVRFELVTRSAAKVADGPCVHRPSGSTVRSLPLVAEKQLLQTARTRRRDRDRHARFREAAAFAFAMDLPLNTALTITWHALLTAGERNEGNCIGRDEQERERYIRKELARLCRNEGLPFAALWGRDIGHRMGAHVHILMFWPQSKLAKLIAVIERVSGSRATFVRKPYTADTVARSVCGGWQINMTARPNGRAGAMDFADYISEQHAKHPAPPDIKGKAFGISEAIGKAAQARARPMLEAREALYGWMSGAARQTRGPRHGEGNAPARHASGSAGAGAKRSARRNPSKTRRGRREADRKTRQPPSFLAHTTPSRRTSPMTTDKQIAANRRNAARSTGPKTEAGKAIVARNAVSHGLLSRRTLLVGESKAELTNLGKALRARLAPVGEVEALLADQIIASAWRLKHALGLASPPRVARHSRRRRCHPARSSGAGRGDAELRTARRAPLPTPRPRRPEIPARIARERDPPPCRRPCAARIAASSRRSSFAVRRPMPPETGLVV